MYDLREPHLTAMKCILSCIQGTLDLGFPLHRTSLVDLTIYSDVDWAGYFDTRRSTSGYGVFLGDNLISWSSKRQATVSRSSAEAEYRAIADGVAEAPHVGYANSFMSFIALSIEPLLCTVTM
jgi:hypothetical protein